MPRKSVAIRHLRRILLGLAGLSAGAAGCRRPPPTFDSLPIPVDMSAGVPMWLAAPPPGLPRCDRSGDAGVGIPDAGPGDQLRLVIDVGSPLTVMSFCPDEVRTVLDRLDIVSALDPSVVRARFLELPLLNVPESTVGLERASAPAAVRRVDGIVGATLLGSLSLRLSLDPAQAAGPSVQLFPSTAGSNEEHALACDAVLPFELLGGGNILVNGSEHGLAASRIVLAACLEPVAYAGAPQLDREDRLVPTGVDLALMMSTAVEPLLLGDSTVRRVDRARAAAGAPPLAFEDAFVHTPGGPIPIDHTSTHRLVLVEDSDDSRGPCEELALARTLEATGVCPSGDACSAAAYIELERALPVGRVSDEDRTLQALRSELRGSTREIDGLLGAAALRDLVADVDYPHSRLVARCSDTRQASCRARPHYAISVRERHLGCLPFSQAGLDGGLPDASTDAAAPDAAVDPDAAIDDASVTDASQLD